MLISDCNHTAWLSLCPPSICLPNLVMLTLVLCLLKSFTNRNADLVMKIMQLLLACSSVCLVKASVSLVKLGDRSVPRPLLILAKDSRQKTAGKRQQWQSKDSKVCQSVWTLLEFILQWLLNNSRICSWVVIY